MTGWRPTLPRPPPEINTELGHYPPGTPLDTLGNCSLLALLLVMGSTCRPEVLIFQDFSDPPDDRE